MMLAHGAKTIVDCSCLQHGGRPNRPTKIERILVGTILAEFPVVREQEKFGRFKVDAYLPLPYHLAFEADGSYWHNTEDDVARDAILMEEFALPVVHLSEKEILAVNRG